MLSTMVGRDILRSRTLTERIEATDYDHLIVACLLHDIGYVRGVLKGDTGPRGQNPLTQESRFDSRLRIRGGSLEPRRSDGGRVAYFEGVVAG
jgi:hypothetical protein